ncbi:GntR family transcriptional regulator [Acetonema longum]|uniref:GntR family transcriptional regulator n=1 Tax=Acetonema longum DSM 6540 TaxID=1009370 RepID=F7NET5_9FIRM|nr:GntR family transcriptional regulator [Acetonema longum]EGO65496.1 GntR family transcriptional regulator [Acetonema longum DSM 6540]
MQYDDQLMILKEQALGDGQVYSMLRRAIVELYLQPGAILSIKDICEHFAIGRSPVRDALVRLDQEGLVTLLPQRGTMISRIDFSRVKQERFLRLAVEEEVMKLFMACHTPSDIALLQETLGRQQDLYDSREMDIRRFFWLDEEFHQTFYAATDKLFCLQAVQGLGGHYRRIRLLTCGDRDILQEILRQHNGLLHALQTRDTELMCNIFQRHLHELDLEEELIVKKYPHLFHSGAGQEPRNLLWRADYLQTLKNQ